MYDNNLITLLIMPKPFASARIPEAIDEAINKRAESGNESRTDIIVNALNVYLDYPYKVAEGSSAGDRIAKLEERVAALEQKASQPVQANQPVQQSLLDNSFDNNTEKENKKRSQRISTSDNTSDNKTDNKNKTRELLSHEEVVSLTGIKLSIVRSRFKEGSAINAGNQRLIPDNSTRYKPRWKVDNIS